MNGSISDSGRVVIELRPQNEKQAAEIHVERHQFPDPLVHAVRELQQLPAIGRVQRRLDRGAVGRLVGLERLQHGLAEFLDGHLLGEPAQVGRVEEAAHRQRKPGGRRRHHRFGFGDRLLGEVRAQDHLQVLELEMHQQPLDELEDASGEVPRDFVQVADLVREQVPFERQVVFERVAGADAPEQLGQALAVGEGGQAVPLEELAPHAAHLGDNEILGGRRFSALLHICLVAARRTASRRAADERSSIPIGRAIRRRSVRPPAALSACCAR